MAKVIVSDLHAHKWSVFSETLKSGVNSRLQIIIDELIRAGSEAARLNGDANGVLVIAGDIFHVRGSVDPEVLNPIQNAFREILNSGVDIWIIPGNHDLSSRNSSALYSAVQTLSETKSDYGVVRVFNEPTIFRDPDTEECAAFVPWTESTGQLLEEVEDLAKNLGKDIGEYDLILHTGIDGVLRNMPDHGLSASMLAQFGFRNVFSGHYHNYKDLGDNVYSIGALTHQTWGDIDTKAGYLSVDNDGGVTYRASHAPNFVDVTGMSSDDMEMESDGNYVRLRAPQVTPAEITQIREDLKKFGAVGVSILAPRATPQARGTPTQKSQTLDDSVGEYIKQIEDLPDDVDIKDVERECMDILKESRSVTEEA